MPRRFSLRSLLLAVLFLAASVTLWRNVDPWLLERTFDASAYPNASIQLSPDSKWIFAASGQVSDSQIHYKGRLWRTVNGESWAVLDLSDPHLDGWVRPLSRFSPDSKHLVAGYVFRKRSFQKLINLASRAEVKSIQFAPDSMLRADFASDGATVLYTLNDTRGLAQRLDSDNTSFLLRQSGDFQFTICGTQILSLDEYNPIRVYDVATGRMLQEIDKPKGWAPQNFAYATKEFALFYASPDPEPDEHDFQWHVAYLDLKNPGPPKILNGYMAAVSPDSSCAVFSTNKGFRIVELATQRELAWVPAPLILDFAWTPDGQRVISQNQTGIRIYEAQTGKCLAEYPDVRSAVLFPDRTRMLSKSPSGTLMLCDLSGGDALQIFDQEKEALQIFEQEQIGLNNTHAIAADGQRFITQNTDTHAIHLWHRHRPEHWYGLAWLPEFWITLALTAALGWSLHRDRRDRCAEKAVHAP